MVLLGDTFPNFTAQTNIGEIDFHNWLGDSWGILFSHPNDFTPVCTTELARVVKLFPEFQRMGIKIIALSCDSVDSHLRWISDIKAYGEINDNGFPYPIIADQSRDLAITLGMLDPSELNSEGLPVSARTVFIIDPLKKMRLSILYPASTGRNFDEILRVVESLQLTEKYKVATPVDWKKGQPVMILPTVNDDEAKQTYGNNIKTLCLPSGKSYLRIVPQPTD
ncbi:PREDICTED: peroxiredoxin-6 [Ceratosolen solmsi marchali]|uniref:1-Cys peroxiredoxin n=1 Tax=Ceratosolen solmsi marchali TaxID=326594 RepID=A0AAJ6YX74_9HYME|nr:PREDICTED: peroxiredoxin-6 [Ceratosolen solmsi marchali]